MMTARTRGMPAATMIRHLPPFMAAGEFYHSPKISHGRVSAARTVCVYLLILRRSRSVAVKFYDITTSLR